MEFIASTDLSRGVTEVRRRYPKYPPDLGQGHIVRPLNKGKWSFKSQEGG
jgi:hypothetical protein